MAVVGEGTVEFGVLCAGIARFPAERRRRSMFGRAEEGEADDEEGGWVVVAVLLLGVVEVVCWCCCWPCDTINRQTPLPVGPS